MKILNCIFLALTTIVSSCGQNKPTNSLNNKTSSDSLIANNNDSLNSVNKIDTTIYPGSYNLESYLPLLSDKSVGVVVNQSSLIEGTHLIDTLISRKIQLAKIYAPEHGFRGKGDAGEIIKNERDSKTGLEVISLYGKNKKPSAEQLQGINIMVFDLQDVGVRFYTYISTMHYIMEACAENDIPVIILDRPNPNGDYVAGPVLDLNFQSFVGMHPIPIVHGLTVGELAQMINKEGWLKDSIKCDLSIIKCLNYNHGSKYELPVKPSPNLPNYNSIRLYPTLCLLEPTKISVGRGTYFPFEVLGSTFVDTGFCFTPKSIEGMSKYPKSEGKKCCGIDFRKSDTPIRFTMKYLYDYYHSYPNKEDFYVNRKFFNLILGTDKVSNYLEQNVSWEVFDTWYIADLEKYKKLRLQYLLYPDSVE